MNTYKIALVFATIAAVTLGYDGEDQKYEATGDYGYSGHYEHHVPLPYNFKYSVEDTKTGDQKSHHETNEGGVVKGYYALKEADGTIREVHYTADKHNGFNAVVKKSGTPIVPPTPYPHRYHESRYHHLQ